MYIVVVLSVLAMMIPMSIPVSAAGGAMGMTLVATGNTADPTLYAGDNDSGYNVFGSTVKVAVVGDSSTVRGWAYPPTDGYPAPLLTNADDNWAEFVSYSLTEAKISAAMNDNTTVGPIGKKWGSVYNTVISQPLGTSSYVSWNEDGNVWLGTTSVTDTVIGQFNAVYPSNATNTHVAQGAILNWYLVDGWQTVDMTAAEAAPGGDHDLGKCGQIADMFPARFSKFSNGSTYIQSVSGADGTSTQVITSNGAESIKIVIVVEYPGDPEINTVPEVATYSFKKANIDAVPQLRWAGEKAILEADFGDVLGPQVVKFSLGNESNGELSAVGEYYGIGANLTNTTQTVWVGVDNATGMYPVAVEAQKEGKVSVDATLYAYLNEEDMVMVSQQSFTVYFLQLNSLVLSDVIGKRVLTDAHGNVISHKDGLWTESNPWDETLDWEAIHAEDGNLDNDTRNVSTDALLRARVTGWFGEFETDNPAGMIDVGNGRTINLPEGRYIMPDDWDLLAGSYKTRPHWDIMCDPSTVTVLGVYPMGPYFTNYGEMAYDVDEDLVAAPLVVGPFSPSLEVMTNTGWAAELTSTDEARPYKTVVPDGELNKWDAPMPPAKIIFEIMDDPADDMDGVGYFKDAFKEDIYYIANEGPGAVMTPLLYTNPFYFAMIPAHEYIPATSANGWYDWDTFGTDGDAYGPYRFWQIMDPVQDVDGYPTEVEVYSDNHGEAMVYLNGDYDLPLNDYDSGLDINYMDVVGTTTVQAIADYPYFRNLQAIYSNTVQKTWTWGGQILGPDEMEGAPMVLVAGTDKVGASDEIMLDDGFTWEGIKTIDPVTGMSSEPDAQGKSNKHVVWIWATDRDGMQAGVLGTQVDCTEWCGR